MLDKTKNPIREHNRAAAAMWGSGGRHYDDVSFAISDALAHAAQRLAPQQGDKVLDVATGTGWTARNVARMGGHVCAIDIASELLEAAADLSVGFKPAIEYRLADAESLPFPDATFDGVISTFGVMFAADHAAAAAELARVCKPGGRLVLATWVPEGAVARFFGLIAEFTSTPPPEQSPIAWGDPEYLSSLLGSDFELMFEHGYNHAYHESCEAIWNWYTRGFGPLRTLCDELDAQRLKELKSVHDEYHDSYRKEAGLCVDREYLVTIGRRN